MAFAVVVLFYFYFFFHLLQTTDLYFIQDNVWGYMVLDYRTQRFDILTAKQLVDTALGEIAPEDAKKYWVSLVQSQIVAQQTNDEAIDFKLSSRCACRMLQERSTLGITRRNLIY